MAVIRLRANAFSFKPNNNLWPCEIDIDFNENNCIVLTGINAGGKSLTLRALDKFSALLCTPNFENLNDFVNFSKLVDIDTITAEYSLDWPPEHEYHFFNFDNDLLFESLMKLHIDFDFDDWEIDSITDSIQIIIQNRFSPEKGFERRIGCRYSIMYDLEYEAEDDEDLWEPTHQELFWDNWKEIFITAEVLADNGFSNFKQLYESNFFTKASIGSHKLSQIESYQMEHFGPSGFEKNILEKFGADYKINDDFYNEGENKVTFVCSGVKFIDLDALYEIGTDREEILREFHDKTVRAKSIDDARKYFNNRLNKVFDKHKQYWEERQARVYSQSLDKSKDKSSKIPFDELLSSPEFKYAFAKEIHPRLFEAFEDVEKNGAKVYADFLQLEESEFNAKYGAKNHGLLFSFVDNPGPLKVHSIQNLFATIALGGVRQDVTTGDFVPVYEFNDDITGWLQEVTTFYYKILYQHDPEFAYICLSYLLLDYPDMNSSQSYYSSGQRRMLSMISEILTTRPETVIFIDEPEISLHIDWQRGFIDKTLTFTPNLLLATHSPDIIYNHPDKVVEVPPSKEV